MKPQLLKTDIPHLLKDSASGALINTDKAALDAARARSRSSSRLDQVETDVAEIKCALDKNNENLEQILRLLHTKSGN